MKSLVNRRSFVTALVLSPALIPLLSPARAQETSPFAGLGLPELDLTVTATSIEGMPATVEAGRYLVNVAASEESGGGGVQFVRPAGDDPEAFAGFFAPSADDAAASPEAVDPGATVSEDEFNTLLFGSSYTGGAFVEPGDLTQVVLDLTPGQWLAAGGFEEPQPPVYLNVTGEMPASLPEPDASATISMADYSFAITAGQLTSGLQVIKVENTGSQPHHIYAGRSAVPLTDADMETIALNPDEHLIHVVSIQTISAGNAVWLPVTLSPGPHVMLCYFPSLEDGAPHFAHGMYLISEVLE